MVKKPRKNIDISAQKELDNNSNSDMIEDGFEFPDEYGSFGDKDDIRQQAEIPIDKLSLRDRFLEDRRLSMFPDDYLIINDIFMSDIPTTSIELEKDTDVFIAEPLRTSAPVTQPVGRNNIRLNLTLAFKPGLEQSVKLRRLVAELRYNPIVYIYNNKVRKELGIGIGISGGEIELGEEDNASTIFILDTAVLRNSPEHVGVLVLDLALHYFNYKPFSKRFWYNARLPGVQPIQELDNEVLETTIDLGALQGYEASAYTLNIAAERTIQDIRKGILELDPENAKNYAPVPFPSASEAWMYYADHMTELVPTINDYPSDFVGFEVEKFEHYNPPNKATRIGNEAAAAINARGLPFAPTPIYDADAEPIRVASEGKANGLDIVAGNEGSSGSGGHVKIGVTNKDWRQTRKDLGAGQGRWPGKQALEPYIHLSPILGGPDGKGFISYARFTKCNIMLFETLYRSGYKVPTIDGHGHGNALVKNKRGGYNWPNPNQIVKAAKKNKVQWGQVLVGKNKDVFNSILSKGAPIVVCWSGDASNAKNKTGVGRHVGILNKVIAVKYESDGKTLNKFIADYYDQSKPKTRRLYWVDGNPRLTSVVFIVPDAKENFNPKEFARGYETQAQNRRQQTTEQQLDKAAGVSPELANQIDQTANAQEDKRDSQQKAREIHATTFDITVKEPGARQQWITDTEELEDVEYYRKDPKLKNLFIRRIRRGVHSNPLRSSDPEILPGMVCSGVSLTFGHRIVPIKLLGQNTPTWQHLGAGNKTGHMVFTFSGAKGRQSASYLLKLIEYSHENARKYSALIPEAGSIKLIYDDFYTGEINSLFALLGIENIVITNIEDRNIPGQADQYQLVLQFVNQEFSDREQLQLRNVSDLEMKRQIIKTLMKFYSKRQRNVQERTFRKTFITIPFAKKANPTEVLGIDVWNQYVFPPNMPWWLGRAITNARSIIQEAEDDAPPIDWKLNQKQIKTAEATSEGTGAPKSWRDRYSYWGAQDIIEGDFSNIDSGERNTSSIVGSAAAVAGDDAYLAQEYHDRQREVMGDWDHDGGPLTNAAAARVYNRWLDKMDVVVREIKSHMASDPDAFDAWFPGIRQKIQESLITDLGSCYEDMNLPPNPAVPLEKAITLPPEFYIYDDSLEGEANGLGDRGLMEARAEEFMNNEMISLEEIIRKRILGGSYLSINRDKIIQNRRGWNEQFGAEWGFHWGDQALYEGARTWEPAFYRKSDPDFNQEKSKAWMNNIKDRYAADSSETKDVQNKFMENVISMNSYLNEGRQWLGADGKRQAVENAEIVRDLYGENANSLAFGPNIRYSKADKVLSGVPLSNVDKTTRDKELYNDAVREAKETGGPQKIAENTYVQGNGAIVVTEKTEARKTVESIAKGAASFGGFVADIGEIVLWLNPFTAPAMLAKKVITTGYNLVRDKTAKQEIDEFLKDTDHEFSKKQTDPAKLAAQKATGIALGRKTSDLSVRRAFPTFKIYFIEDDSAQSELIDNTVIRAFDDFYSYAAVQEIKITRSRKIPGDLAVIRMTNLGGKLLRRRFGEKEDRYNQIGPDYVTGEASEYATGIYADTESEHPFEKMILQDGVKVQIRLGYCADEKTEILTKRGWLKYNELLLSDSILTLNHETGNSEWSAIDKINIFDVENEPMIEFSNRFHSSFTTRNHKWPILHKRQKDKKKYYSREFTTSEKASLNASNAFIAGASCSSLPSEKYFSDEFVELMAWFWTEGSITNIKNENRNPCVVFSQSHETNQEYVNRIRKALQGLFGNSVDVLSTGNPWGQIIESKWTERKRKGRSETNFRLNSIASKEFVKWAPNRIVSNEFILKLTKEQLELFINVSNMGDGNNSKSNKKPFYIAQKNPDSLDALELASILAGYKVHRYKRSDDCQDRFGNNYKMTCLSISQKVNIFGDSIKKEEKQYTGKIWCPTTKNKTWCARREGTVYYTGNSSDPDHLESVFLGQIVEVGPSEDQKMLEIVCQGFAVELDNIELGPLSDGPIFYSTQSALSAAILSPHVVHFGRQSKFNKFTLAEMRSEFTGGEGRGPLTELFSPYQRIREFGANSARELVNQYRFLNNPQDDNIYAPPPSVYANNWEQFWDNACMFRPVKQTAWDIFKEHELRHPGYVSLAVPYGHSGRMTMFFGPKYQHYWAAPVSPLELYLAEYAESEIVKLRGVGVENAFQDVAFAQKFEELASENSDLAKAIYQGILHRLPPTSVGFQIGRMFGRYKPFRNFFYVDSEHHIISNEIRTSKDGTFNEVELRYFDDEESINPGITDLYGQARKEGSGRVASAAKAVFGSDETEANYIVEQIQQLERGHEGLLTVKLDENMPDEHIRSYTDQYPSCITSYMAKRYAQGLFLRHLRDTYKGTITILGNEEMKPYDVVYLDDKVTDMQGPIEIEAVTHVFNRDWGFITMITPDLCLDANEFWSVSTMDIMGSLFQSTFGSASTSVQLALIHLNPFAYLGVIGGVKFMQWTQDGAPVVSTPLTLGGKPFLSIALGPHSSSLYTQLHGKWEQWWDDLKNSWNKLNIAEDMFDTRLSFKASLAKWAGNSQEIGRF